MIRPSTALLSAAFVFASAAALPAAEVDRVLADELALKSAGLPADGAGLLDYFRTRSGAEASQESIAGLVKLLDAPSASARAKACAELTAVGPAALPALRRAASDPDAAERAALARRCVRAIDADSAALTSAAARLLAVRRPAGAVEALLAFLPCAEDENVVDEVKAALTALAYHDGKADPVLARALEDPLPLRRAAAVDALCHAGVGSETPHAALRKLLQDPVPVVRLRAALALAQANDAEAVTALVGLLADVPPPLAREAEDYLYALAGEQAPKAVTATDAADRARHRDAWKAWWDGADGKSALDEFRKRTVTDADREKGQKLILRLGDDDFATREKAAEDLKAMGGVVAPLLRREANHPDAEVSRRVRACLEAIEKDKKTPLPFTAPRIVALRKPADAAAVLLAYLPVAENDNVLDEIQAALCALAYEGGKPDPALVRALEDRTPARRSAAAAALCQPGVPDELLPALRKLLKDSEPSVRLHAGLALAGVRERAAIPVLIALLGELPAEETAPVEDYLLRVAAERPPVLPEDGDNLRKRRREAWAAWWEAQGGRVQLVGRQSPAVVQRYLGYTLLIQQQNGIVSEVGADGKVRWQLTGLSNVQDAQVLPGDRVLVTESGASRVTERNLKGDILWEKRVTNWPLSAQRLPNGNTFIVSRNHLLEVDRSGKEVLNINRPTNDIMTAAKMRDGRIRCVSSLGKCFTLDERGKESASFSIGQISNYANDLLANGGVVMPVLYQNKVVEYDPAGKVVWEATVQQPIAATRLPNGNTLVSLQQWPARVIELDRAGKQVAEITTPTYTFRIRRR